MKPENTKIICDSKFSGIVGLGGDFIYTESFQMACNRCGPVTFTMAVMDSWLITD